MMLKQSSLSYPSLSLHHSTDSLSGARAGSMGTHGVYKPFAWNGYFKNSFRS